MPTCGIIDKLLFDKSVYKKIFDEIISLEIHRQRDKSNTNATGYFHQNIFKYISKYEVPVRGWDVIYSADNFKVYVEMKNKRNTMNLSSSQKNIYTDAKSNSKISKRLLLSC